MNIENISKENNQTLNNELKEMIRRFRRNSTPGRINNLLTLQTEDNLKVIDQDIRMVTDSLSERGELLGNNGKKDRGCFPTCCLIY
jgi:hypothetical protein